MKTACVFLSILCASSLSACSDGGSSSPADDRLGDGDSDPGDGDADAGDGDGDGSTPSAGCEGERPEGAVCLASVTGTVVGEDDEPVSDLAVTVCGPVCFRGVTNDDGSFEVAINRFVIVSEYSVQAHGTPHATTFYHLIPTDLEDGGYDAGTLRVIDLPEDGDVLTTKLDLDGEISPEQTVSSSGVTLTIAEGTVVRLSVGDALEGEEGRRFRARELDADQVDEFVPELAGARVFALGPFEAEMMGDDDAEPEVSLSVENSLDWEAGSEIEVLALGTYLDAEWLTPSAFEPIGTATVSDDRETIDLAADASGAGLNHLTWFALMP